MNPLLMSSKERLLIIDFLRDPQTYINEMINYFNNLDKPFYEFNNISSNSTGQIRCIKYTYGYEVKIGRWGGGAPLDYDPGYYGLTLDQSKRLHNAILSCVASSTIYQEKL